MCVLCDLLAFRDRILSDPGPPCGMLETRQPASAMLRRVPENSCMIHLLVAALCLQLFLFIRSITPVHSSDMQTNGETPAGVLLVADFMCLSVLAFPPIVDF